MLLETGKGRIENFSVTETGGQFALQGRTNWIQVSCSGEVQVYLTQQDFNNYTNFRRLVGTDDGEAAWEAPLALDRLWMRAVQGSGTASVTITYSSQI